MDNRDADQQRLQDAFRRLQSKHVLSRLEDTSEFARDDTEGTNEPNGPNEDERDVALP